MIDRATLDGANGFRLNGIDAGAQTGRSVSSAGDVDGDGFADIIIKAFGADPNGDSDPGESYVVSGTASGFAVTLSLSALSGTNGFRLDGIDADDQSGRSVSSAGTSKATASTTSPHANPNGDSDAGGSYLVVGRRDLVNGAWHERRLLFAARRAGPDHIGRVSHRRSRRKRGR